MTRPKKTEAEREATRQRIRERLRAPKPKRRGRRPSAELFGAEKLDIAELEQHLNREYLPPLPRKWMCLLVAEVKRLQKRLTETETLLREVGE